jgi:hypothetical protein
VLYYNMITFDTYALLFIFFTAWDEIYRENSLYEKQCQT